MPPFWAVAGVFVLTLIGHRERALITIAHGDLTVERFGLFRTWKHEWPLDNLTSSLVLPRAGLAIYPQGERPACFFKDRDESELEWIRDAPFQRADGNLAFAQRGIGKDASFISMAVVHDGLSNTRMVAERAGANDVWQNGVKVHDGGD